MGENAIGWVAMTRVGRSCVVLFGFLALWPAPAAASVEARDHRDSIASTAAELPANAARSGGAAEVVQVIEARLPRPPKRSGSDADALDRTEPPVRSPLRVAAREAQPPRPASVPHRETLARYPNPPPGPPR